MMNRVGHTGSGLAILLAVVMGSHGASAQDKLTLAVGQRGNWDTAVSELGARAGIFEKHGLELEILYTQGGGETLQTVISGAVDIGVGPAVMAALGAFSKGAPVRAIGAEVTSASDLFWYVRSDSPIQSLADMTNRTIAYSTTGSSTHEVVTAFLSQFGVEARPTATGGPPSTLTQVMSGQIDMGWSAPPFGMAQLDRGEIRIVANGNDALQFRDRTVRLLVVNARNLGARRAAIERYMDAYRETIDWMYENPEMIRHYTDFAQISDAVARRTRDAFFPKENLNPDRIIGLDRTMPAAVELRYLAALLTPAQLDEFVQIPPRKQ